MWNRNGVARGVLDALRILIQSSTPPAATTVMSSVEAEELQSSLALPKFKGTTS